VVLVVQISIIRLTTGKALQGQLAGYWRYRVGDYRLIFQIKDGELIILVIEIGHRKEIYRSHT
jgi:mRNA interferase RelE/StbE